MSYVMSRFELGQIIFFHSGQMNYLDDANEINVYTVYQENDQTFLKNGK